MRHLLLPLLLALLALSSCRPEGVDGEVTMQFTELVTFKGNDNPWGGALFTFRRDGDSPEVQLTSDKVLSDQYKPGERMLILYTIPSNTPYTSGRIDLLGVGAVTNAKLGVLDPDAVTWDADPVYLQSVWRTGHYINVHVRLPYSAKPRHFGLALDPATRLSAMPRLYLVHQLPADAEATFDRSYDASFDISAIWDTLAPDGVEVHVENSNLNQKVFVFKR